jgi:hypothetical protein
MITIDGSEGERLAVGAAGMQARNGRHARDHAKCAEPREIQPVGQFIA